MRIKYYERLYGDIRFDVRQPVLDIGGSNGDFLSHFGIGEGRIIDIKDYNVQEGYQVEKLDLNKCFGTSAKYKTIFVMEVLEHLKYPLYVMSKVRDCLDDDGICYVSIPYTKLDKNPGGHINKWKLWEIIKALRQVGFSVEVMLIKNTLKGKVTLREYSFAVLKLRKMTK